MSVAYEAVLDVSEGSVLFLSMLLHDGRVRRGTRKGTLAMGSAAARRAELRNFQ